MRELKRIQQTRKDCTVIVMFSSAELEQAKENARKYANGNLSEWLRYSSTLEPRAEDITEDAADDR